jgi:hypothetical protein
MEAAAAAVNKVIAEPQKEHSMIMPEIIIVPDQCCVAWHLLIGISM